MRQVHWTSVRTICAIELEVLAVLVITLLGDVCHWARNSILLHLLSLVRKAVVSLLIWGYHVIHLISISCLLVLKSGFRARPLHHLAIVCMWIFAFDEWSESDILKLVLCDNPHRLFALVHIISVFGAFSCRRIPFNLTLQVLLDRMTDMVWFHGEVRIGVSVRIVGSFGYRMRSVSLICRVTCLSILLGVKDAIWG